MKDKKLEGMSNEELQSKITDAELELMKLHGQSATGTPPQKPAQIKTLRRSIARFKTAMKIAESSQVKKTAMKKEEAGKK